MRRIGAPAMDLSMYYDDFTQRDLFGLFPGAAGGRALRDTYGREYLVAIAAKGGRTTLERYGLDNMRREGEASQRGHTASFCARKRHRPRSWLGRPRSLRAAVWR